MYHFNFGTHFWKAKGARRMLCCGLQSISWDRSLWVSNWERSQHVPKLYLLSPTKESIPIQIKLNGDNNWPKGNFSRSYNRIIFLDFLMQFYIYSFCYKTIELDNIKIYNFLMQFYIYSFCYKTIELDNMKIYIFLMQFYIYSFCYKTIELLQDLAWPHHKVNNTKNPSLSQATRNKIK